MATTTGKLGLPRPEATDNVTLENEQALIDAIDHAAAAQADLDTHKGDNTAHVTTAERAAWNAKETPAGAQAKAEAAVASVQSVISGHMGSGGSSHALATSSAHGFMSSIDKTKLDGIESRAQKNTVTSVAGKTGTVSLNKDDIGLGSVDNVKQAPATRTITAGSGLSGGGDFTANRTISLGTPGTLTTTSTNTTTATSHTHAVSFPVTSVVGKTGAVSLVKGDVGLGSVQNYGIATQANARAGTANNVYMTPLRTKEAIDSFTGGVQLRVQSGLLQFNDGGTWKAVGGVKNVQRGTAAMGTSSSTVNITLSAVDISKTQVNITWHGRANVSINSSSAIAFSTFSRELTSSTNLRVTRFQSSSSDSDQFVISYEVIEFN